MNATIYLTTFTPETAPAEPALRAAAVPYRLLRHGRVDSLAQAARVRGIDPSDLVKTLVVRRTAADFIFVLVPGDREIWWPKIAPCLG